MVFCGDCCVIFTRVPASGTTLLSARCFLGRAGAWQYDYNLCSTQLEKSNLHWASSLPKLACLTAGGGPELLRTSPNFELAGPKWKSEDTNSVFPPALGEAKLLRRAPSKAVRSDRLRHIATARSCGQVHSCTTASVHTHLCCRPMRVRHPRCTGGRAIAHAHITSECASVVAHMLPTLRGEMVL